MGSCLVLQWDKFLLPAKHVWGWPIYCSAGCFKNGLGQMRFNMVFMLSFGILIFFLVWQHPNIFSLWKIGKKAVPGDECPSAEEGCGLLGADADCEFWEGMDFDADWLPGVKERRCGLARMLPVFNQHYRDRTKMPMGCCSAKCPSTGSCPWCGYDASRNTGNNTL